ARVACSMRDRHLGQTVAPENVKVSVPMPLGMLGQKVGMTQVYDESGKQFPVTVLRVGPNPILLVRNQQRDGYDAVQVGFIDKERRKAIRAERGHVAADLESKRKAA